ncbi:MAG TPA: Holliday junction resolvase RuvX [Candidatus Dormibacteraeota bacterium]|nr:Holliday junction resolvase RuvX [Candidatus Dormibacteraeota bacterium]
MEGRVLAVDPGSRRVGLALSDERRRLASPLRTLDAEPAATLADRVAAVALEVGAVELVVGLPSNLDGSSGEAARSARTLADGLKKSTRLPVSLQDERLSSVAAERHLVGQGVRREKRRGLVDQLAAALVLETFLARRRDG